MELMMSDNAGNEMNGQKEAEAKAVVASVAVAASDA